MKKRQIQIKCALLCALLALTAGLGCAGEATSIQKRETSYDLSGTFLRAEETDELVKISENEAFVLYANLHDGTAAVEDKAEGRMWYTNPEARGDDGLASGFHKNALLSAITLAYTTGQGVSMTCGGYMSSVAKDGLYYCLLADGSIVFLFSFPNEGFSIPVRYAIEKDCFTATILTEYVAQTGDNVLNSIDLLPFFGAGSQEEDGFMLVPDGSGALIYYNNNRLSANTYMKALYGFDNGTNDKVSQGAATSGYSTLSEKQYLPVFGSATENGGFFAIITEGAARAVIKANVAGKYTQYNTVWSTYNYRTIGTVRQTQKDGSETAVSIGEKNLETWMDYQVSYYLLESGRSTYSDMAALYRQYLVETEGLTPQTESSEQIVLYLDLYGYIEKTKSFMGIPRDTKITMTSIEDANRILDTLESEGITNVVIKYNDWAKNSYYDRLPRSAAVDRKVGTTAQMLALKERLEAAGGQLFLGADLMNVYKTGKGISRYNDVLESVANTAQRQYVFNLDNAAVDTRYDAWYLLRPASMERVFSAYLDELLQEGYSSAALDSVGTMLYSELSSNGMGRNQVRELLSSILSDAADATDGLMVEGAAEYAAVNATHILNTSSHSSGYDLEDVSVPFYQMVFHGYASYSLSATNLSSDPATTTLRCIEFGAYPLFSLVSRNSDELIGSRSNQLFSADAANWTDYIARQYRQVNEVLGHVQNTVIVRHEIAGDALRRITYDNGAVVYVNYGTTDAMLDGIRIPAGGYALAEGGVKVLAAAAVGD